MEPDEEVKWLEERLDRLESLLTSQTQLATKLESLLTNLLEQAKNQTVAITPEQLQTLSMLVEAASEKHQPKLEALLERLEKQAEVVPPTPTPTPQPQPSAEDDPEVPPTPQPAPRKTNQQRQFRLI